jgi:ABC-type nitrate/sulfonate/bicarbonate transport system permease component
MSKSPAHLKTRAWLYRLIEFGSPILIVAIWWVASDNSKNIYYPPLHDILIGFWSTWFFAHWMSDAMPTVYAVLLGYSITMVLGLTIGIVLGLMPGVNEFFRPMVDFFRTTPTSASVPLLIVIVGVNIYLKIAVVMMAAMWVVIMNTSEGFAGIDATVRDTCKSYRISRVQRLFRVYLPAASPQILTGMRVALFQSIILTIVSEMLASSAGIGTFIRKAQWSFQIVDMWSGIFMVAFISFTLVRLFQLFEYKILAWHRGHHRRNS